MAEVKRVREATIKDVAQLAGVSISTVSRVINKQGGVSDELTERIECAVAQLRYHSNSVARALRVNSTHTLGFVVPSVENPVFGRLAQSIEKKANEFGFLSILCNSEGDIEREIHYLQLLIGKKVDGILFNAMGIYDKRLLEALQSNIPIVVIGRKIPGIPTTNVTTDNRKGACDAVSYMIETGLRRIAFIHGLFESVTALEDRYNGYRDALLNHAIPFDEALVANGLEDFESGAEAVQRLVDRDIEFEGIFASNDLIALSCIKKLGELGMRIPGDVSVMGYDMIPFSQMHYPQLSTVNSNLQRLGEKAAETILDFINGKPDTYKEILIRSEVVLGGTTR